MKYDYLRDLPVKSRPKLLPVWDRTYFSDASRLNWFILASLPGVLSAVYCAIASNWILALIGLVMTQFLVLIGFTAIYSGIASSNWGTYFRTSEPARYWTNIVIIAATYIFTMIAIWFGK